MKRFIIFLLLNSVLIYSYSQEKRFTYWPQTDPHQALSDTIRINANGILNINILEHKLKSNSLYGNSKTILSPDQSNYWIDSTGNNVRNIKVSRSPQEVLITNDDQYVCVRSFLSNTIEIVEISTGEIVKSIMVPSPKDFVISNDGTKLIVASLADFPMPPNLPPDDCMGYIIGLTGQSLLTTINISSLEITKVDTIKTWSIKRLLESLNDSIIYLQGHDVFEYDLSNSKVRRKWNITEQIWHSKIDNKNQRVFLTTIGSNHENFLKTIDLLTGEIITSQCYSNGEQAWTHYIGIDTLSNRVFIQGKYQPHSEVLVFDAISLKQLPPIVGAFLGNNCFIPMPKQGSLFIGRGYPYSTLELDYQTLNHKQILPLPLYTRWHDIIPSEDKSKLFSFRYGSSEGGLSLLNPPQYLDISEYDIKTGHLRQYTVTDSAHECCYMRNLATTKDGQYLVATNSPENTISIFKITDHGIDISDASSFMEVFPNPTSGIITVSINKQIDVDFVIEVYDCIGTLMYKTSKIKSDTDFKIDLSKYTKGQYFIHFNSEKESCIQKVIKF